MHVSIQNLCTKEMDCNLSLDFDWQNRIVLYDEKEEKSSAILTCFADVETIRAGSIKLNGIPLAEFYQKNPIIKTFGYIFDTGIMLSNLSILENFLLPYQLRWGKSKQKLFYTQLQAWLEIFHISVDSSLRPAFIKPSILKLLCYIRALLLKPSFLLLDNPYYLLNQNQRKLVFQILQKQKIPMLIASIDDDFAQSFADKVINLSDTGISMRKKLAKE